MAMMKIMMQVTVLLFKSQPCSKTHLHTITCCFWSWYLTYLHIFSIPFQELNMFWHSPPHRSLVGPLPCRAMVTHQYHRVDQALNRIMMIILHFRILNLSTLFLFARIWAWAWTGPGSRAWLWPETKNSSEIYILVSWVDGAEETKTIGCSSERLMLLYILSIKPSIQHVW